VILAWSGNGPAGQQAYPRFLVRDLRPADLLAHRRPGYYQPGELPQ